MAPQQPTGPVYQKNEKALCFHGAILYNCRILDARPASPQLEGSPPQFEYKVHYDQWKTKSVISKDSCVSDIWLIDAQMGFMGLAGSAAEVDARECSREGKIGGPAESAKECQIYHEEFIKEKVRSRGRGNLGS